MSYQSEVLADSPIYYFRLNEPSGTNANDLGSANNDGTYTNTPTLGVTGAILTDPTDTAVTFAAAQSEYVTIPDVAASDVGDTFTFEAWVKINGAPAGNIGIFSFGTQSGYMRVNSSDSCVHILRSEVADMGPSTVTVVDNLWHHIVWTKATTTNKIYIDGVDRTGTITNATMSNPTVRHAIGADVGAGPNEADFFTGSIDEVAVYGTALSIIRVQAHYNAALAATALTYPPRPLLPRLMRAGRLGRKFLSFPTRPWDIPVVSDVTVVAGAAIGLGITPAPVVKADVLPTSSTALGVTPAPVVDAKVPTMPALALGSSPAPVVDVKVLTTAAIALGSTPAPTVIVGGGVTVFPGPAIALGSTPAPIVLVDVPTTSAVGLGITSAPVVSVVRTTTAALGLGITSAPVLAVTKVTTAALALGSTPSPATLVVVFPTAALALGSTPAPTIIIAGNVTVFPAAALALGSTPQPVVLIDKTVTAALALGVTPNPTKAILRQVTAALGLGITPIPTAIAGVFAIPASVAAADTDVVMVNASNVDIASISPVDALGVVVVTTDSPDKEASVTGLTTADVRVTDVDP
jgi:Concanavalin A-like lectin/glucanases superfamily